MMADFGKKLREDILAALDAAEVDDLVPAPEQATVHGMPERAGEVACPGFVTDTPRSRAVARFLVTVTTSREEVQAAVQAAIDGLHAGSGGAEIRQDVLDRTFDGRFWSVHLWWDSADPAPEELPPWFQALNRDIVERFGPRTRFATFRWMDRQE